MYLKVMKTKSNTHFYIIESFRDANGKSVTRTFKKLGDLQEVIKLANGEDPHKWAEKQAIYYTEQSNEDRKDYNISLSNYKKIDFEKNKSFNVGYLHIESILHKLNLHQTIKSLSEDTKIEYDLSNIFLDLIYGRILYPSSKKSTFEETKNLLKSRKYDLQHVYRSLDILAENSDYIQERLYKNSLNVIKRDTRVLYYDCTNFYFEIEGDDDFRKYGRSKENRPNPIVQMGLFLDGSGIPLAFDLTPGNTNEQTTLKPLEKKILRDFDLSDIVVCTDAGLSSASNRRFNNNDKRKYVTVQSLKKIKTHLKEWALDPDGWSFFGSDQLVNINDIKEEQYNTIFYKERWINENGLSERLIISFSLKYANYQSSIREKQVNRAIKKITTKESISKSSNPNDVRRFINVINTTKSGEVSEHIDLSLNEDQVIKEAQYDGFYGVITNLEDPIQEIIKINKGRWEIEESFRIMKTDFKSRPVYLTNEKRIKAHFLTCFVSLVILRMLENKLDYKYTTNEVIKTIRKQSVYDITGLGYIPTFERTTLTDALDEISKTKLNLEIIDRKTMKENKRITKK